MNSVILSLGSNKGSRDLHLHSAVEQIEKQIGKVSKASSVIETAAWGYDDADYLNQCIWVETALLPQEVLSQALEIEKQLGRERTSDTYQARTIDIDLLFYDNLVLNFEAEKKGETLSLPHPFLHKRDFVLQSLVEICPHWIHPVFECTVADLYAGLD